MKAVHQVNRYIAKVYDDIDPDTPRVIDLVRTDHWPDWFAPGRVVDLDANIDGLGTVRIFGSIEENTGHVLKVRAYAFGDKPTKVWSMS